MDTKLETPRTLLRFLEESDLEPLIAYFKKNEARFEQTSPPRPTDFYTLAFWKKRRQAIQNERAQGTTIPFFIFSKASNSIIGNITLSQVIRGAFQAAYLGYAIDRDHEGQGIMFEALQAAIQCAFKDINLHRIMANHLPENQRSARLLKRLGFVVEGLAKDYLYINGRWRDHVLNSLTNDSWENTIIL